MIELHENIYGHKNRVDWFTNFISKEEEVLEFGCGTGVMVSAYLLQKGYNMYGVDLDCPSVELGQNMYKEHGLDPSRLMCKDIAELADGRFDVIIATEVFEHIEEADIDAVMTLISSKLKSGGKLIVTVPNGYGWFELESFIWNKLGIGFILNKLFITKAIYGFKERILGMKFNKLISTIAHSPHVRRFTLKSIRDLVEKHGYEVKTQRGSCIFAGSFSALIFGGFRPFEKFNIWLGSKFPALSSGFYTYSVKK
jgi:SAM-dependent methyltransferase